MARKKSRQLQVSITHDLGPLLFIRVSITAGANFPAVLERQIDAFATDCFAWLAIGLVKETLHRADIEWFPSSRDKGGHEVIIIVRFYDKSHDFVRLSPYSQLMRAGWVAVTGPGNEIVVSWAIGFWRKTYYVIWFGNMVC